MEYQKYIVARVPKDGKSPASRLFKGWKVLCSRVPLKRCRGSRVIVVFSSEFFSDGLAAPLFRKANDPEMDKIGFNRNFWRFTQSYVV